jgi:hypothetical protein
LRNGYLIIVQTMINGAGPFSFLLDTGTTRTVIDPDLARQLQAPAIGKDSLAIYSTVRQVRLVHLDGVQVGYAEASDLGVMVDKLGEVKFLQAAGELPISKDLSRCGGKRGFGCAERVREADRTCDCR